jgi:hypothetical protein
MGILIFENCFVVLEIFDFGTVTYGPNLPPYVPPANNAEIIQHYKTTKTTASMTTEEVTCRVLVIKPYGNNDDVSLAEKSARVCLKDCPNTAIETRPWEFILNLDGTVECLAVPPSKSHHDKVYPARFRIPSNTLLRLGQEEKNKRSEMFALGSLLYEINSGNKPFEELSDDEVQLRFSNGDFPDDITSLQLLPIILSCWSLEFSREVEKISRSLYHFYCFGNKL